METSVLRQRQGQAQGADAKSPVEARREVLEFSQGPLASVPVREVRVAAMLSGGIALAVYENGVAAELYHMTLGRGVYGVLKQITLSDAFVDIMSGTSAGGINGVLLSAALANCTDFDRTRNIWIEAADIEALLQKPQNVRAAYLFQGEDYYLPTIRHLFDELTNVDAPVSYAPDGKRSCPSGFGRYPFPGAPGDPQPPPETAMPDVLTFRDLDMLVTGTFFEGQLQTYFDARNRPLLNENHAGLFRLKHRPERGESHLHPRLADPGRRVPGDDKQEKARTERLKNVGDPSAPPLPEAERRGDSRADTRRAGIASRLARIARTTSSLPAVFEPSVVDPALMNGVIDLPTDTRPTYMFDGGFLNNRPLDHLIRAIYRRSASGEVARKALIIDPDPAVVLRPPDEQPERPTALGSVWFFDQVPHGQSLTAAIQAALSHNHKVRRLQEILDDATEEVEIGTIKAAGQTQLWCKLRLRALRRGLVDIWGAGIPRYAESQTEQDNRTAQVVTTAQKCAEGLRELSAVLQDEMQRGCLDVRYSRPTAVQAAAIALVPAVRPAAASDAPAVDTPGAAAEPLDEGAAAAAEYARDPALFFLDEIDTGYLNRMAMRAMGLLYDAIYPRPNRDLPPKDAQRQAHRARELILEQFRRAAPAGAAPGAAPAIPAGFETINRAILRLNRLAKAAEVVQQNVVDLLIAFAQSEAFREALRDPSDAQIRAYLDRVQGDADSRSVWARTQYLEAVAQSLWLQLSGQMRKLLALRRDDIQAVEDSEQPADTLDRIFKAGWTEDRCRIAKGLSPEILPAGVSAPATAPAGPNICVELRRMVERTAREASETIRPVLKEVYNALTKQMEEAADAGVKEEVFGIRSVAAPPSRRDILDGILDLGAVGLDRIDAMLYPVEEAADLPSRSEIELIEVSARDAQLGYSGSRPPDEKMAGDALGHFGGFFKRSWRVNDIFWGRMDASGILVETLLEPGRLERIIGAGAPGSSGPNPAAEAILRSVEAYVLGGVVLSANEAANRETAAPAADGIGKLLASELQHFRTKWDEVRHIEDLTDPAKRADLRDPDGKFVSGSFEGVLNDLLHLLLRRHQLEIVVEEVPEVVGAAMLENSRWVARDQAIDGTPGGLRGTLAGRARRRVQEGKEDGGYPDRTLSAVAVQRTREEGRALFAGSDGKVDPQAVLNFFLGKGPGGSAYEVGKEDIQKDIPPLVTAHRLSWAGLVMMHVLGNSLSPGTKESFFGKILQRFLLAPVSLFTGVLYGLLSALTAGSRARTVVHAVLTTVIVFGTLALIFHLTSAVMLVSFLVAFSIGIEVFLANVQQNPPMAGRAVLAMGAAIFAASAIARAGGTGFTGTGIAVAAWSGVGLTALGLLLCIVRRWGAPVWTILVAALLALGIGAALGWTRGVESAHVPFTSVRIPLDLPVRWAIGLGVGGLLLGLLAGWRTKVYGQTARNRTAPEGVLSLEMSGSTADANEIRRSWRQDSALAAEIAAREAEQARAAGRTPEKRGPAGIEAARASIQWDFLFIVGYVLLLFAGLQLSALKVPPSMDLIAHGSVWVATLQIVAGLLDALENISMLRFLGGPQAESSPETGDRKPGWALPTGLKFGIILAGLVAALACWAAFLASPTASAAPLASTSPAGDRRPAEPQYAPGPQGPAGSQGAPGPRGPEGPAGPKGDKGDKGATGDAGPAGAAGAAGPAGSQGPKGDKGDKGDTGAKGPAGPKGDKGAKADKGAKGAKGPTGSQGAKRSSGPTG